jgi:hypothetical protein
LAGVSSRIELLDEAKVYVPTATITAHPSPKVSKIDEDIHSIVRDPRACGCQMVNIAELDKQGGSQYDHTRIAQLTMSLRKSVAYLNKEI